MKLTVAQTIVTATLAEGRNRHFKPLGVVVLDARGAVRAVAVEDGTSLKRYEIAYAKAYGVLALGMGSRALMKRSEIQPAFISAATLATGGNLVPVPGGVLIKDATGATHGAIGVSGDTSDHDEIAAMAGIAAVGLAGDPGA